MTSVTRAKQRPDQPTMIDPERVTPAANPQLHGHRHPAAFSVVLYAASAADGGGTEELWNAWDGPPPIRIKLLDSGVPAVCALQAVYVPDYVPEVGERIGVPMTEARARVLVAQWLAPHADDDPEIERLVKVADQIYAATGGGRPALHENMVQHLLAEQHGDELIVTSGYLADLQAARAAGRLTQHAADRPLGVLHIPWLDAAMAAIGCSVCAMAGIDLPPASAVIAGTAGDLAIGAAVDARMSMVMACRGRQIATRETIATVTVVNATGSVSYIASEPTADAAYAAYRVALATLTAHGFHDLKVDMREALTRDAAAFVAMLVAGKQLDSSDIGHASITSIRQAQHAAGVAPTPPAADPAFKRKLQLAAQSMGITKAPTGRAPTADNPALVTHAVWTRQRQPTDGNTAIVATIRAPGELQDYQFVVGVGDFLAAATLQATDAATARVAHGKLLQYLLAELGGGYAAEIDADGTPVDQPRIAVPTPAAKGHKA